MRQVRAAGLCLAILALVTSLPAADVPDGGRVRSSFNPGWKVFVGDPENAATPGFDDAAWRQVTTPHSWNEDEAFKADIRELPTGIAWYRKHFRLPATSNGKKVYLEFEGIRQAGRFFLNGQELGLHENGINAFGFDVTDKLRPTGEENVLAVRIDSAYNYREQATGQAFQWNHTSFNASYGGINRNVWLHIADPLHQTLPLLSSLGTTGVYIYADQFDLNGKSATIHAESQVRNDHTQPRTVRYEVAIRSVTGEVLATLPGEEVVIPPGEMRIVKAAGPVRNLDFWSWGFGKLYDVDTVLKVNGQVVDGVRTRTGFRKTQFTNGMFTLNGRVLHLKGYAQRTTNEWPALGSAVPAWLSDFSNGLMVENNASLVRWMHTCPWKQDVESCDRVGLIQAMPAGDSESDVTGRRWEQRVAVMRDAIIYNRNNPSIIFYECGNKGISEDHMREMKVIRDEFDPHGGRAIGAREMLSSTVAEYGGEMLYVNKSADIPMWMMEYSRDEGLRKYWDNVSPPNHQDAPAYNRNQDSHAIENVIRWFDYWQQRPGTGKRVNAGGANIIFSDTNTHHRGDENYRRSGEVDPMRIPKDGFFAHQMMWNGWVNVEQPGAYIMGHWNYSPEVTKNVTVVSSADQVELFLNDKSLGKGEQSHRFLFTFKDVKWQPGKLVAVGYDSTGKKVVETFKVTAGPAVAIRLTPIVGPAGFFADGHDVALVDVEVVDAQGLRCPVNFDVINFELTGAAEYRGGIAQGEGNLILSKSLPVECGVNRVIIRSTTSAGSAVLTAKAAGLQEARVELLTKPVAVTDGLSQHIPRDLIPEKFRRGPTPAGDGLVITRKPVEIASVNAGSNPANAPRSYDDDEYTNWASDGTLANSWIEYRLARPAAVSQLTFKTGQHRNQTYPVKISVDGKEVWAGELQRTLGFVNVEFTPTTGSVLRIDLTGRGVTGDGFGIIEITGARLGENPGRGGGGGNRGRGRGNRGNAGDANQPPDPNTGTLSINEIEVFEPVR